MAKSSKGGKKDCRYGVLRFKDTYSAKVGRNVDNLDDVLWDQDEDLLYNQDAEAYFDNVSEFLKTCYVVQDDPMPCTVLAMIPILEV